MADEFNDGQFFSKVRKGSLSSKVVFPVNTSGKSKLDASWTGTGTDQNFNDPDSQFVKNLKANILKESELKAEKLNAEKLNAEKLNAKKDENVDFWGFNANDDDLDADENLKPPEYKGEIIEIDETQKKIASVAEQSTPETPARPRALQPISEWGKPLKMTFNDPDEEFGVRYVTEDSAGNTTLGPNRGGTAGSTTTNKSLTSASRRVKSPNLKKNTLVSAKSVKGTVPPPPDITQSYMAKKFAQAAQTIMNKINSTPGVPVELKSAFKLRTPATPVQKPKATSNVQTEKPKADVSISASRRFNYGPEYGTEEDYADFQNSKTRLPVGNYFQSKLFNDIVVTEVQSPDCFYIRNNETAPELEYMEECMNEWYVPYWNENANIDRKEIFVGCFYTVYVADKDWWYRGKVDSFVKEKDKPMQVCVQLMDYGTMVIVNMDCLLPLRKVYYQLPIQAAIGSLQMVDDSLPWRQEEIRQFKTDVEGKRFQAFITEHKDGIENQDFSYITLVLLEIVGGEERPYSLGTRTDLGFPNNNLP